MCEIADGAMTSGQALSIALGLKRVSTEPIRLRLRRKLLVGRTWLTQLAMLFSIDCIRQNLAYVALKLRLE